MSYYREQSAIDPRYGIKQEEKPPEVIFLHEKGTLFVRIVKVTKPGQGSDLFMETSAPGSKDLLGVQLWSRCGMDGQVGILAQALFNQSLPYEGYTRADHEALKQEIQIQKDGRSRDATMSNHALTAERTKYDNLTTKLNEETKKLQEETRKLEEAYAQMTELKKQLADYESRLHSKGKGKVNGDHPFR